MNQPTKEQGIKELVERVAEQLLEITKPPISKLDDSTSFGKELRNYAKQILSHPDLALILKPQHIDWDTELEIVKQSKLLLVIPLANALKEGKMKKEWRLGVKSLPNQKFVAEADEDLRLKGTTGLREGMAQRFYDAVFPGADWNEPNEYEKEPFYNRADEALAYLKSQIEQMANPYSEDTARSMGWNACQNMLLGKLSSS